MSKNSFLKGAFILGIAGVIVNILGAVFRIPLGNIIGSEGMGYYQTSFPIYILLVTVSASGFPTAISKLVSEKIALKDNKGAYKIFRISFLALIAIGIISFCLLFFGARIIVNEFIKSPKSYYSMIAIAPALLLVPIMSTFRGYFQGRQEMAPTAVSQVMEQIGRVGLGLFLALLLMPKGKEFAAAGAAFGGTAAAIFGTAYMAYIYMKNRPVIKEELENSEEFEEESGKEIITRLLKIAIPITIGTAILPIMNLIDTGIVIRRLQETGLDYEKATSLFGQLTGMAQTLINFPQVLTLSLATSLVPVISHFYTIKDMNNVRKNIRTGLRVSILIGLPATFGLATLATPIMQLLYPKEPGSVGEILLYLSLSVIFLGLIQATTAILQGMEKVNVPVVNILIGALVKLVISYVLIGIPHLNVKGAAIGTVTAYMVISILNLAYIKRNMNIKLEFVYYIAKPLISSIIMGILVILSYKGLFLVTHKNSISTLLAIGVGGLAYGLALIMSGGISEEEILMMPKGAKINNILKRYKLIKQ